MLAICFILLRDLPLPAFVLERLTGPATLILASLFRDLLAVDLTPFVYR